MGDRRRNFNFISASKLHCFNISLLRTNNSCDLHNYKQTSANSTFKTISNECSQRLNPRPDRRFCDRSSCASGKNSRQYLGRALHRISSILYLNFKHLLLHSRKNSHSLGCKILIFPRHSRFYNLWLDCSC